MLAEDAAFLRFVHDDFTFFLGLPLSVCTGIVGLD